jgi:amidophosphoribosyltransferase
MPGQSTRKRSVRQKLNTVTQEFKGKRVLLVWQTDIRKLLAIDIESGKARGKLVLEGWN